MTDLDEDQAWRLDAACRDADPQPFHAEDRAVSEAAIRRHCLACPVSEACRDYADAHDEEFGVWGGQLYTKRGVRSLETLTRGNPEPKADRLSWLRGAA